MADLRQEWIGFPTAWIFGGPGPGIELGALTIATARELQARRVD